MEQYNEIYLEVEETKYLFQIPFHTHNLTEWIKRLFIIQNIPLKF